MECPSRCHPPALALGCNELANLRLGLGPKPAGLAALANGPKPLEQGAVTDPPCKGAFAHAGFGKELFDLCEDLRLHNRLSHAYAVAVKHRIHANSCTHHRAMHAFEMWLGSMVMDAGWRHRLVEAIERDERSPRAISLAAKLGPNYLTQMLERGTAPSTQALVSLCQVLGVSLTYIFTGAEMSPEDEELLRLAADLPEKQKDLLIEMARQLQDGGPH